MRLKGTIKILAILFIDFVLIYSMVGLEIAIIAIAGIMLYGWLGEYIALFKDGAISLNNLNGHEKSRLLRLQEYLSEDVNRISGISISNLRFHVLPSDNINAYAYGFHNISITRAMLNSCDDTILCSVLGHEISHILNMDMVIHRVVFANVAFIIVGLMIATFLSVSFMWLIFIILCVFGICDGLFSRFVFHGGIKLVRGSFTLLQYVVLFIYQIVMGFISRESEFRADKYSCQLGYGPQLSYFLTRFVEGQEAKQRSLNEILYASHPIAYKRIIKIERFNLKS